MVRIVARFVALIVFASLLSLAQEAQPNQTGPLDNLFVLKNRETARVSSFDRTGGNVDYIRIAPGETRVLANIAGAGVIRRFYMAPLSSDRMRYRKMVLRIYWDGSKEPCVEVPLGDFFGSGLGTLRYFHSAVVDVNPGFGDADFDAMVNYLPMPFAKGARITLENDGGLQDVRLWYHFDYEKYPSGEIPSNWGRLHAQWHRVAHTLVDPGKPKNKTLGNVNDKNNTGEENYVVLDATGQGSFVGLFLTIDNVAGGWYGEGDDMVFVDGAGWPPTYPGTGTEEVFNSGCCPNREFSGNYTGFYLIQNYLRPWGGKNQMYRFYTNDPIRFQKSIRFTIEHGHDNNFENDYTSTAFWYQVDPHEAFPTMPPALARLPEWPEGVREAIDTETKLRLQFRTLSADQSKKVVNDKDAAEFQTLEAARNQEFRALRFDEYIRDVNAAAQILTKYSLTPTNQ